MSLSQGFPNTFTGQVTNQVTKNLNNETKKIYTDINNIMSTHAHTNNGSDGALISAVNVTNTPAGNITSTTVQAAINEIDVKKTNGVSGMFKNLKITNGATANSQVLITTDAALLWDSNDQPYTATNVSATINTGASGVNGIDTGSVSSNKFYSIWLIYNGTTVSGLLSLSSTSPTMPSGYTYKVRLGWVRTNGSSLLYRTIQYGRKAQYIVDGTILTAPVVVASGSMSATAIAVLGVIVPPTATVFRGSIAVNGANNSGYLSANSNSSSVIVYGINASGGSPFFQVPCEIILESANVYYFSNSTNNLAYCYGWEDNI